MTTYEEALKSSLEYFIGDDIAAQVFLSKYALQDENDNIIESTPDQLHRRLAKEFARIEKKYANPMSEEQIYNLFKQFKYVIPQGSPMAGIGNPYQTMSISNCFVIDSPHDSYGGILKTDQEEAQIMKRRGGVGFDVSTIRPRGVPTSNAAKTTDGIAVFMDRFSNTCREVAQGGRRGALMLSISVNHPEIMTFVKIKNNRDRVQGANISIRLTDEFMNAVKNDEDFNLRWPVDSKTPEITGTIKAKELWHEIIKSAHGHAEPGLLFWDTIKKYSPADAYSSVGYGTTSTNPCGEVTLSPYDSCRLLVLNVNSYVKNPFTSKAKFDYKLFYEHAQMAQRLMDDMIDLELECVDKILAKISSDKEPEEVKSVEKNLWLKIKAAATNGRRTGTGLTGVGDAVAALNMRYGSDECIQEVEKIYKNLALGTYRASVDMAKERGAFPAYSYSLEKDHPFINRIMNEDPELRSDWVKYGRRNIANTTTAPCGSISIEAQVTSGIEPVFMLSYMRRRKINSSDKKAVVDFVSDDGQAWQEYTVYHHGFKTWMDVTGKTDPTESPYHLACSNDIDWVSKVRLQAAAQKWICHSISNTTNLPVNTSVDVVKDIYMTGWESGCKGVTVYREGCRDGVLISTEEKLKQQGAEFKDNNAPKRPEKLPCEIYHMQVKGEKWNIFVGLFEDRPYEIFAGRAEYVSIPRSRKEGFIKKNGKYNLHIGEGSDEIIIKDVAHVFENPTEAAFTRTISLALRHGAPVQYVVEQIEKGANKESDMFSLAKGIMRVLKNYIKDGTKPSLKKCEVCGSSNLIYTEGCISCTGCSWSKCG